MTDNADTYPDDDLMEAYIYGTLGPEERTALEQRIADDPRVAEKVALHRKVVQIAQAARRQRLQARFLEHFDKRERVATIETTGFLGMPNRTFGLVVGAAALVLLLLYGAILFRVGEETGKKWAKQNPTILRDTVFVQNPQAEVATQPPKTDTNKARKRQIAVLLRPPTYPTIRNRITNAPALDTLERYWNAGRYKETVALAEAYLRDTTSKRVLELYGDSAFKAGDFDRAEAAFLQLEAFDIKQEAKWNRLLCYAMQLPDRKMQFDSLVQEIGKWKKPNAFEKDLNRLVLFTK